MALRLTGKLKAADKVREVGANSTRVRKFWIDITGDSAYDNFAEFQLMHDSVGLIEGIEPGAEIEVTFRINGRKTKYTKDGVEKESFFQNLQAYKIVKIERNTVGVPDVNPANVANVGDDEGLPF